MAWNDPGRNRNPWGNRPDRGAADLDEALRNLQQKLAGMFGGRGGGGAGGGEGGGGDAAMRGFSAGTVVLVLVAIWAATWSRSGRPPASTRSTRPSARS